MMRSHTLYFFLFLSTFPVITPAAADASTAYTATDFILLNCGASSNLNDTSKRRWDSDERTSYMTPVTASISSAYRASDMHPSILRVPYETARISPDTFSYSFPIHAGPKFIRLYFYPTTYSTFNASQSFFSVFANGFIFLRNFSPLNTPSPSGPSVKKEFIISVQENQSLTITFIPDTNSFAFINGIEIVSLPDHLYFRGNDVLIKSGNKSFYLKNDSALENLYRLNVGGNDVEIQDDSGPRGMFRAWSQDDNYIFGTNSGVTLHSKDLPINYSDQTPPYSAPEIVYTTSRVIENTSKSLEWAFPIDAGFKYLLRFHFCEFQLEVIAQNERVFDISVDNEPVDVQVDVIFWTGGTRIPIFKDYIVRVFDDGRHGKKDLRVSLFPNTQGQSKYQSALLNGLEIFKISDASRNLVAANPEPEPPVISTPPTKKTKGSSVIYPVIGSLIGVLAVVAAVSFFIFQRRRKLKESLLTSGSSIPLPSYLCRRFLLEEIKTATSNFQDNFIIGKGGFGSVYKGFIDDGATTVAIKRLNSSSNQGIREFLTEIEMLSKLRYLHLVSLIGYCDENGEMILIYDYMAHGTLHDNLYNSDNSSLNWKQRLQICIGSAKGLCYLHTSGKHAIIHRDVKSTNILLDEKWVAKVSDLGLSKVGPTGESHTHVSTAVKGSFGYVDPEYYKRQQLTDKSDVYSFGVVLFEVLCARPAIVPSFPGEQANLAEWANFCYREGRVQEIIDPNLDGQIVPECLSTFVETGVMCLREKGVDRPAMNDVVRSLEHAMQLQEVAENRGCDAVDCSKSIVGMNPTFPESSEAVSGFKGINLSSDSNEKYKWGEVFSEIKNPVGR
ncbi:Serine/threonine protein kinase [Handroanthus impetiginosus]|uniref:Serine/threonine protein kinase n=1 Tax=Handroanthus impetiginosus TaxID=429701 RepID=A0A2G9IAL6_9LAMI|nr:Serine/threonine protein kinase [Handroanthus impetiginosus]